MKTINKVVLLGNIVRDAKLKELPSGKKVCTFGLATNRVWKDPEGKMQNLPEYHNIVCWGPLADVAGKYARKGKPLYIEGYLKTRSWETAKGARQERAEVVVEEIVFIATKDADADIPDEDGQ